MSADLATLSPQAAPSRSSSNPFEAARLQLIKAFLALKVPAAYPAYPSPDDHLAVANLIREAAQICDEWLAAIGSEVRDNAVTSISAGLFAGSFTAAVDGNETFAVTEQGEALIQYAQERRSAGRGGW